MAAELPETDPVDPLRAALEGALQATVPVSEVRVTAQQVAGLQADPVLPNWDATIR